MPSAAAPGEEPVDHRLDVGGAQRCEVDPLDPGRGQPVAVDVGELRPGGAEDEDRGAAHRVDDVVKELEERRLGRVDVVDDDDEGSLDRLGFEKLAGAPEQLRHRVRRARQPDGRRDPVDDRVAISVVGREQRGDPAAGGFLRIVLADPGR